MADQLAQGRNMVPDSRAEFEAHYGPRWGRHYLGWVESAGRYEWDATQEAWFVWQAATQRQQERIAALEAQVSTLTTALIDCREAFPIPEPGTPLESAWMGAMAEPEDVPEYVKAQVQALSLDAFAKDASIGHLSRLVDAERMDAARYQWLRGRDLETISHGGVFAGKTPDNVILNGEDLDRAIDAAIAAGKGA